MMRRRLLERVLDEADGSESGRRGPEGRRPRGEIMDSLERSVVGSLRRIFRTVHGDASIDSDYGLPDVGGLSRSMPAATEQMREAIVAAVERYEPRLCSVRVLPVPDEQGLVLRFEIVAQWKTNEGGAGQTFKVATRLQSSGHLVVDE
jgi:type VI secretion system protein